MCRNVLYCKTLLYNVRAAWDTDCNDQKIIKKTVSEFKNEKLKSQNKIINTIKKFKNVWFEIKE